MDEALGEVVRYDLEHGTELVTTLRTWVGADYNVSEAAQRLYVHTNTLKYRLKRIRAVLGGDPSRGDLRLQVELALKMLDLPAWPPPGRTDSDSEAPAVPHPVERRTAMVVMTASRAACPARRG